MAALIPGQRRTGSRVLTYQGFRYTFQSTLKDNTYSWRCWKRSCRGRAYTNPFDRLSDNPNIRVVRASDPGDHNHPADIDLIFRRQCIQELQDAVALDPTLMPREVWRRVSRNRQNFPPFHEVRPAIERFRASLLPAIPQTVADVDIRDVWAATHRGRQFVCEQNVNRGIVVFATTHNLRKLQECRTLYMDGTFSACPRPFHQIFTILGEVNGHVVPLVHVLMANRLAGTYRAVFRSLKQKVRNATGRRFRPRQIIVDFELAIWGALSMELAQARILGCYFHFSQALWRHAQQCGLSGAYGNVRRVRRLIRKIFALGFLPLHVVRNSFNILRNSSKLHF